LVIPNPLGHKFYPNWDPHGHFQTARYDWSQLRPGFANRQTLNEEFFETMRRQHGTGQHPSPLYVQAEFQQGEPHDVTPIGTVLEFRLHFQSLLPWELGLLLFSMGIGTTWLPKLGGAKAYGLGSVWVDHRALHLVSDIATYTDPAPLSAQGAAQQINDCLAAFRRHLSYHDDGMADLGVGFSVNLHAQQNLHIASNTTPMRS
jgi:hypothetical protein